MNCPQCNQPMNAIQHITIPNKSWKMHRYHCVLCNHSESILGDGQLEELKIEQAIKEIAKQYKQEEENRNG